MPKVMPKIVVRLMGGLGNQLFQFQKMINIIESTGETDVAFDISFYKRTKKAHEKVTFGKLFNRFQVIDLGNYNWRFSRFVARMLWKLNFNQYEFNRIRYVFQNQKDSGYTKNSKYIVDGFWQEARIAKEKQYYCNKLKNDSFTCFGNDSLAKELRERFERRQLSIKPKQKGNLHILTAYKLINWEFILPLALKPFGKVSVFEWGSVGLESSLGQSCDLREAIGTELLKKISSVHKDQPIDAMIGYFSDKTISPALLEKIARLGIVIFNFSFDDKLLFKNLVNILPFVDLNLTNSPDSCIKYVVEGGLSLFWPEAAHPDVHRPYDSPFDYDVSFIGKKYGKRPKIIKYLRKKGIKVTVFGQGWDNGTLSDEEMIKIYSRSRINLGFGGVGHCQRVTCLKARDFEIPMSGGLYITQNNPELSSVYEVGKEILTYDNARDCSNKIFHILNNPEIANDIRIAGRNRALRDHTWEKRFETIFRIAGLIK